MKEMDESIQQVIKQSIEDLENVLSGMSPTASLNQDMDIVDPQILIAELEAATDARDQMAQRCHELDMQVIS